MFWSCGVQKSRNDIRKAGLKDEAAIEYEEYLKKDPNYLDRDKLKEYIAANKKD